MKKSFTSILLVAAFLLVGCFGAKQLDITSYSLNTPSPTKVVKEPRFGNLFVQDFYVNPTFEDKNFTYQTGDLTFESDFYNQLKLSPRSQFTTLTRITLAESGLFKTVIMPESQQAPDYTLEATVSKFFADFRDKKNAKAHLAISFRFFLVPKNGKGYQLLFEKTFEESVPISQNTASAVAHAWNAAYGNIIRQLMSNLAKTQVPGDIP